MRSLTLLALLTMMVTLISCENRDINEGEEFRPREVSEDFETFHFNTIEYDGVKYLITERDNNNPHEGFGFMAVRGNELIRKQDSILAYLRTIGDMQSIIYARTYGVTTQQSDSLYQAILNYYLNQLEPEVEISE